MKNIIFMQDIDTNRKKEDVDREFYRDESGVGGDNKDNSFDKDSAVRNPQIHGRRWPGGISPYKYSIESWKRWAEKNNADVIVMEDFI